MLSGEADSFDGVDDRTLARRAGAGDSAAFRELVDRHSDSLFRTCYSLSATRTDAEDLLQETFAGAYGGLKNFNGASSVKTWLTSILMRQAAKAWHRNRHHRRTRSLDSGPSQGSPQSSNPASRSPVAAGGGTGNDSSWDVSGQTVRARVGAGSDSTEQTRSDLRADLQTILARIDPSYREIIVLRELQQLTYDEISVALDIPRGTVESRLFRARAELRRRMRDYQSDK